METSWEVVELGSVSSLITSGSRGWAEFYADEGAAFLRITNLTRRSIRPDIRDLKRVKLPVGNAEGNRTRLQPNDILVSITADLGIVGLAPDLGDAYVNQHIALIRPSCEVFPAFVAYYLSGPGQAQFARLNDAGAKAGLNLVSIRKLSLVLPPLGEQRKIAALLSTVDDAIEATQAVIDQLQVVKKAMMAELLTRGLPGRHTRFKQTEIGEVPESWSVVCLDELIMPGRPISYGVLKPGPHVPHGVPVVRVTDYKGDQISLSSVQRSASEIVAPYTRSVLRAGDLLISIRGTAGRVCIVPNALDGGNISRDSARISLSDPELRSYIYCYLRGPTSQAFVLGEMRGLAVQGINLQDLRRLPVPIPGREERSIISDSLLALDEVLRRNQESLEAHEKAKSALMQVLLTGAVRVTPDEDAA